MFGKSTGTTTRRFAGFLFSSWSCWDLVEFGESHAMHTETNSSMALRPSECTSRIQKYHAEGSWFRFLVGLGFSVMEIFLSSSCIVRLSCILPVIPE